MINSQLFSFHNIVFIAAVAIATRFVLAKAMNSIGATQA